MSDHSGALDTVIDLCRNEHRRIVLGALTAEQHGLSVNDLTSAILKYTHHRPETAVSDDELPQIQVSLHHTHLPKMESAGLIEYDPERGHVEPTAELAQLQSYLAPIFDADPALELPIEL